MDKIVSDLPKAIYNLFRKPHEVEASNAEDLAKRIAKVIVDTLEGRKEQRPRLRLSNLGTKCKRKLWYSINTPELAEDMEPNAKIKYMYGHILEELLLFLAEEAGYKVEGKQKEVDLNGVKGHIDAIVNGVVVDAKSCSTYQFRKIKEGRLADDDPFGYVHQLLGYLIASSGDNVVRNKERAAFLAIDKTLGTICTSFHDVRDAPDYTSLIEELRLILDTPSPPEREYVDEPDGKSGNRKLGLECSYCPYKNTCWPGLRTFLYMGKPRFLTKVMREPNVPELK